MLGLINGLLGTVGGLLQGPDASADVNAAATAGADISVLGIDVGADLAVQADVSTDVNLLA